MVTLRAYSNAAEAALAKSLLDDYGVVCVLADENTHLYVPYAVPVRLLVSEEQVDRAANILDGRPEQSEDDPEPESAEWVEPDRRNPWELLGIAFLFLMPALCFLSIRHPVKVATNRWLRSEMAAVDVFHLLGWLGVIFAIFLIVLYVWAVRTLHRDARPSLEG